MFAEFEQIRSGMESFLSMEGEEGGEAAVSATVEVELEVAKDAEVEAEVIEESAEIEEASAQDAEMHRAYDRLQVAFNVVMKCGWSQPVAMMVDPDGALQAKFPALPAVESLDMIGVPSDANTVVALEAIGGILGTFWKAIKDFCTWIKNQAMALWEKIKGIFDSRTKQIAKVMTALNSATIDESKLKERKSSIIGSTEWETAAKGLMTKASAMQSAIGKMASMNIEGSAAEIPTFEALGDLAKGSEGSIGWDKASALAAGRTATDLAKFMATNLPKAAQTVKSMAGKLDAFASKHASTEEGAAEAKKAAKEHSAAMKALVKYCNQMSKQAGKLIGIYLTAAKTVLACKAGAKKAEA